jgi:NAD(P)H-hydrate repair Nnr-like enzyme with NAD(P)H-hydrate dehydratase domain
MDQDYWQKQKSGKALFPDIEWSKPEQRAQRGKLLIVGGSANGFMSVVKAFQTATQAGAGEVRVAMPDVLKNKLPKDFNEGVFLPSNHSGGLSGKGIGDLQAAADWADGVLLVGDSGQNSETAILLEQFLSNTNKWVVITRDVIDLLMNMTEKLVMRDKNVLVMSFAQTQKLFSSVYYPKILTFSMNLTNFADALHKFTITYPATIVTLHQNQIVVAQNGQVVSQEIKSPMELVDGSLATKATAYLLWNQTKPLEAIATSWNHTK